MSYTIVILIILGSVIVITQGIAAIRGRRETNIADSIIETGIILSASTVPSLNDTLAITVADYLGTAVPKSSNSILYLISGFLFIILGIVLRKNLKDKVFVLNMYGLVKRDISDRKAVKDLKLADYKLKEQIIDFISVFNTGNIDNKDNSIICRYLWEEISKFKNRTEDRISCFTGMAPIPYTVYAGTFLGGTNVNRYFEFNRHVGEKYYELKKARLFNKKWPKLNEMFLESVKSTATDVLLTISISHSISQPDLKQFGNMDIVKLQLDEPKDNVIEYYQQLLEYKKAIYDSIDVNIKNKYPNLHTIHLVASIPSCISIEIGKSIGVNTNRIANVIVYHYVNNSDPKYTFGIYVNGSNKGQMYNQMLNEKKE